MVTTRPTDHYAKFLDERLDELRKALNALIEILPTSSADGKIAAAKKVEASATALELGLPSNCHPDWLAPLMSACRSHGADLKHEHHVIAMQRFLVGNANKIINYEWKNDGISNPSLDFDGIYEQFRNQSRLPELFDQIIDLLRQIIDSGAVDSVRVTNSLQAMIDLLRHNRRGSYFSMMASWDFFRALMRNSVWSVLTETPVIGPLVSALQKTIDDTQEEMVALHVNMQQHVHSQVTVELPVLVYQRNQLVINDQTRSE